MCRRILDLFCGAGGAAMGYYQAGFEIVGVDVNPQSHYPFMFIQDDALECLESLNNGCYPLPPHRAGELGRCIHLTDFDAIHASPPCQTYSVTKGLAKPGHPALIEPTRELLQTARLPYVIENVMGSPLIDPVMLCGTMFDGLRVYRHRLFETSFDMPPPLHPKHVVKSRKLGRPPEPGDYISVAGHFSGVEYAREAMGIPWMTRDQLSQAIPPAYTTYAGTWLTAALDELQEAA